MRNHRPPPHVARAIQEGDREALSAVGKRGGQVSGQRQRERAASEAAYRAEMQERKEMEFWAMEEEANLHICPID